MRKILIVGGVAGGASAAARLRRLNESDHIIMFEKDEYISFANCGLPYYIGGVITEREKLLVQTVDAMRERFNLDVRNFSEVIKINTDNKFVTVYNHLTNETYEESYDKLILSPGSTPFIPPIPGLSEAENVFTLRNIVDTDKIKEMVDTKPNKAVVIGGGFIGVEMAENLVEQGIETTLIEKNTTIMAAPFDKEMAAQLNSEVRNNGVQLLVNKEVKSIQKNGKQIEMTDGTLIETDMIILSIGVRPSIKLAIDANLEIGQLGGIVVNEHLQTSNPDIFAVGDAIEVKHLVSGKSTYIPLAWPANRQGRLVADYLNGKDVRYNGTLGSSVAKVFDLVAASTGLTEVKARQLGYSVRTVIVHRGSHAGYYPGSTNISLKLVFNPETGELYGAQGIGGEGTEKRIDVIATAIISKLKVADLETLELCYAPPFSSAKDPVNILGYVAHNSLNSPVQMISYNEIDEIIQTGGTVIDVRTELEYELGHITGSKNIPVDSLRENFQNLPEDKASPIYITCQVGQRGHLAAQILLNNGYQNIYNLSGGYKTYTSYKIGCEETMSDEQDIHIDEDTQQLTSPNDLHDYTIVKEIDATGIQCPGPIIQTFKAIEQIQEGQVIAVESSDFGYLNDIKNWCTKTGNTLIEVNKEEKKVRAIIQKGNHEGLKNQSNNSATIVLFSGEYDKAMAALIIAIGAASMGQHVSVFCTFWGLNMLKKEQQNQKVDKTKMESMFGAMLPSSAEQMPLSNMNMAGLGKSMMMKVMKEKNVDSLASLLEQARELDVKFIACTMSMDVMGIKEVELRGDVVYGGVASYIADSQGAGLTLFI